MAKRISIILSEAERTELEKMRDTHPKPYLRERASAILKIANGQTARHVAIAGLLKPRYPKAVYRWVNRFKANGVKGLEISSGRGRKSSFFPKLPK
jgi:transposase